MFTLKPIRLLKTLPINKPTSLIKKKKQFLFNKAVQLNNTETITIIHIFHSEQNLVRPNQSQHACSYQWPRFTLKSTKTKGKRLHTVKPINKLTLLIKHKNIFLLNKTGQLNT